MGRLRIKKKAEVIPFRETLAYRMILLTMSGVLFLIFVYRMFASFREDNTYSMMLFTGLTLLTGFAVFYNMENLKNVRFSPDAMKRMKRRS